MKIAVDGMGGDNAPQAVVEGAVAAAREGGCEIILVGKREQLEAELAKHNAANLPITVHNATQEVEMDESPSLAYRKKKDSSIAVGMGLVKSGDADGFISAGNTGAMMAHATLMLRLIPGISRPAIVVMLPTQKGWTLLMDAGASVDCKPQALFEFGIMGSVYGAHVLEKENPTVGLLNIGEEEGKGNEVCKLAGSMLKEASINYIGNTEGKELYRGSTDVVVCDGFVGNITLKVSESVAEMFGSALKEVFSANWRTKLGYMLVKPKLEEFKKRVDYHEYGGAPLLGVNGNVFICHGSSKAKSIKNGIRHVIDFAREDVNGSIRRGMEENIEIEKAMEEKEGFWEGIKKSIKSVRPGKEEAAE